MTGPVPANDSARGSRRLPVTAILALGVLAMSTASVLIRLADAPSLAIGAWRLMVAFLLLSPVGWPALRREIGGLSLRERSLLLLSAVALAAHFGTWVTSLAFTTVASSVILVTTTPIYVAIASRLFWQETIGRRRTAATAVAMAGSFLISYGDLAISGRAFWGDVLAVMGALAMAAHLLLGRTLRRRLSTWAYVWPVYGVAGALLGVVCLVTGQTMTGYSGDTWLVLLALAVIPQILGHSVINWALASVSPLLVTLSILGEPIGASVLAWTILHEIPPHAAWVGGPFILVGIVMASREEKRGAAQATVPSRTPFEAQARGAQESATTQENST